MSSHCAACPMVSILRCLEFCDFANALILALILRIDFRFAYVILPHALTGVLHFPIGDFACKKGF